MKRRHVKLFEEVSYPTYEEEVIFDALYEEWKSELPKDWMFINEQANWLDDEDIDHTSGERAALTRGDQLQTKEQLAALYLFALGKTEDIGADYVKMIDGIDDFGYINDDDGAFSITAPALADAIGLESEGTVSRTVTKFMRLIDGVGDSHSERIYPKLVKAFEYLSNAQPTQIAVIATGAMQDPETSTRHRDHAYTRAEGASAARQQKKVDEEATGRAVFDLIKKLIGILGIEKALPMAIKKISSETGADPIKLKGMYQSYLRKNDMLNARYYI